jgi:aspartokinase
MKTKILFLVITGFIGSNAKNETTLGRNGSNYTASLLLIISMLKNYKTLHVDGIYTANPELV